MISKLNRPKRFGEILDVTFKLSKSHFKVFFFVSLLFFGPFFLIKALARLSTGTSFIREVGVGEGWLDRILSSFGEDMMSDEVVPLTGADVLIGFVDFISLIIYPLLYAAILLGINHLRKNENFTFGTVVKGAFSRFWAILGSSILYGLITGGLITVAVIGIFMITFSAFMMGPVASIIFTFIIFLAAAIPIFYLLTRWSFYIGSVVIDYESPGLTRSWNLTRGRVWNIIGLYIIFTLIILAIGFAVEIAFGALLGNSVLFTLIQDVLTAFTTMIFGIGFAVVFFDLKIRHDGDDLKDMIEEYNSKTV
ncbi:hypothetical protein [Bacillus alkalisoli]|uniref:hypothetical protein n=1 Tax=Bacillus alkalisoli TaxID=2011008 RepID=UPI000C24BA57|nr:hypothetical protein [Bacillus alkalisoli]